LVRFVRGARARRRPATVYLGARELCAGRQGVSSDRLRCRAPFVPGYRA